VANRTDTDEPPFNAASPTSGEAPQLPQEEVDVALTDRHDAVQSGVPENGCKWRIANTRRGGALPMLARVPGGKGITRPPSLLIIWPDEQLLPVNRGPWSLRAHDLTWMGLWFTPPVRPADSE
jgi:hypothetical protein